MLPEVVESRRLVQTLSAHPFVRPEQVMQSPQEMAAEIVVLKERLNRSESNAAILKVRAENAEAKVVAIGEHLRVALELAE